MTSVEEDVRTFFATAPLEVSSGAVPVEHVVTAVRRRRQRRGAAAAVAVTGIIAATGVVAVMAAGLSDGVVHPATEPEPPGIGYVDHLDVITPTDVGGLAIGMTLAEVETVAGVEVAMQGPGDACDARLAVDDVRGHLERWPERAGEMVVTSLVYYGADARTTTDVAVGRPIDAQSSQEASLIDSPLGPAVTIVDHGPMRPEQGPMGVGYQVLSSCHEAVLLGEPS